MERLIAGRMLRICGLHELQEHRADAPAHLISILDPGTERDPHLDGFDSSEIHRFDFHDVIDPAQADRPPTAADVEAILALGERALPDSNAIMGAACGLLVHCYMGVSRSTAALAVLLATRHRGPEGEVFAFVRRIRPQAWPNLLMVRHADRALGRGGRLEAALAEHYRLQAAARPDLAEAIRRLGRDEELRLAGLERDPIGSNRPDR